MSYNREEQKAIMESNILKLYPEQSECFNKIMDSINGNAENNLFYVDGIGRAGKTFLCSTILAAVRSSGSLALAAASSGVAALLLPGGQTGHSLFKIPLKVDEYSTCSISKQSMQAKLLKHAKVIIWDEAPLMHKHVYEALDRTFQDIKGNGKPFGGITTVFGGDISQILAVIPKASPEEIRSSVISQSAFWPMVTIFKLSKNMRLFSDYQESLIVVKRQYADFILNIGE